MTIYMDIIILENLIMNYIILYATAIISKSKVKHVRLIISSLIGAIYAITQYISRMLIYSNFFLKTILSMIMILIAFNPKNLKKGIKQLLLLYLTTFTFGGISTYLINLAPKTIEENTLKIIFLTAVLGYAIITISFKVSKNKISKKDMICKTKIKFNKKEKELDTMIDTGNMLKEPITGKPVIVVEKMALNDLMPHEILDNLEEILGGDFSNIPQEINEEYISRLKIIPFSSLGKENGMLVGIKLDGLTIITEEEEKENTDVIMGIYNKSLTRRGEYNSLIGLELY